MTQLQLFETYNKPHSVYRMVESKIEGIITDEWVMDFDTRWDAEEYIRTHGVEASYYVMCCDRTNKEFFENDDMGFDHLLV